MKRGLANVYAIICTLLLAGGFISVFVFAWNTGVWQIVECLLGLFVGFALSSMLHELGHVCFAQIADMEYVYVKCFCFKIYFENGKKRFGFASPFAPDETQVLPRSSGNMQKRTILYTVGGLIFGSVFLLLTLAGAIVCTVFQTTDFLLWGMVPYAAYLVLLNVAPLEYASGKTDVLVFWGIRKGHDAEKTMLSAMEIQGRLYEGKSFAEIEEKYYFDLPQLCEDEPLYAVMLDLKYRYYLEKEDYERAADSLNRLASAQAYLPDVEIEKLAAELTYMHSLRGDWESAEESGKLCRTYLQSEEVSAKRILLAYSKAFGKEEALEPLLAQARECLKKERIAGVRKFEEALLARIEIR